MFDNRVFKAHKLFGVQWPKNLRLKGENLNISHYTFTFPTSYFPPTSMNPNTPIVEMNIIPELIPKQVKQVKVGFYFQINSFRVYT